MRLTPDQIDELYARLDRLERRRHRAPKFKDTSKRARICKIGKRNKKRRMVA